MKKITIFITLLLMPFMAMAQSSAVKKAAKSMFKLLHSMLTVICYILVMVLS